MKKYIHLLIFFFIIHLKYISAMDHQPGNWDRETTPPIQLGKLHETSDEKLREYFRLRNDMILAQQLAKKGQQPKKANTKNHKS